MSKKALQQLREKQQSQVPVVDEEQEEEQPKYVKKLNAFDMFANDDDDDDDDDENSDDGQSKPKAEQKQQAQGEGKSKKKKKKKNKKKKAEAKEEDESDDEKKKKGGENEEEQKIEDILEELKQEEKEKIESKHCLHINVKALNYTKEMQKFFKGQKTSDKEEGAGGKNKMARNQRIMKHMQSNRNHKNFKKFKLLHGDTSHMMNPERFTTKLVRHNEYGAKVICFEPTKRYVNIQEAYESVRNTFDPNFLMTFIRDNPFHTDGLFAVAELMRTQGDFKETNNLLETVIFMYEDSFSYEYDLFSESEDVVLSFDENEYSKSFFLALSRFIDLLGKKGCYKSALEYNKFLVKINPYHDPVGALLTLDYNSVSAKEWDFLLHFPNKFGKQYYKKDEYSLIYMPNFLYSVALCKLYKFIEEDEEAGMSVYAAVTKEDVELAQKTDQNPLDQSYIVNLIQAMLLFPRVIRDIIEANEYKKVSMQLGGDKFQGWQKKSFKDMMEQDILKSKHEYLYPCLNLSNNDDIEGLNKLLEIYVERSKLIWKNNKVTLVVKACLGAILNTIDEGLKYDDFLEKMYTAEFKYKVPFQMSRYKALLKNNFSDHMEQIDFANIPDQMGQQGGGQNQNANMNPIDPNSGLLNLIFGSLLPWNNLPTQNNNNNNGGGDDDDESLPSDVEINDEDI